MLESKLDRGRGPVATVLVQQGTLRRGDVTYGFDLTGRKEADAIAKMMARAFQHGRVLDGADPEDRSGIGRRRGMCQDRVTGLGGTAGPDQIEGRTLQQPGESLARLEGRTGEMDKAREAGTARIDESLVRERSLRAAVLIDAVRCIMGGAGVHDPKARKTAMLGMALLIMPTTLAPLAGSMWAAVLVVSLAAASHQAWSANVYTLASDMFPREAVGSVVGIGAFAGAMGGVLFQRLTGRILEANGNDYTPIFAICGLAYLTAWVIIHLLAPRLEPARLTAVRGET